MMLYITDYTGDIKIAIKSSSSVQVSWNPLLVPEGVSVVQYKLSYGLKGRQEKMYRFSSPEDTIRNIHNLHSNGVYTLVVCAVLREKDGSLHTQSLSTRLLGPTSDGDLHFYVPGEESVGVAEVMRWVRLSDIVAGLIFLYQVGIAEVMR